MKTILALAGACLLAGAASTGAGAPGPFAGQRKMKGTWVSMGTSITWRNDHIPKKPENAIKGLTRGYQDRVRDVLAFDGFRNLGCNGGTIGIQLGSVTTGDYYTVEHGINDWSRSVPVGTIEDYRHASRTNHTFCATYRKLIDKIRALNPKAKIILCTPRKGYGFHGHLPPACDRPRKGIYLREYAEAVRAIAAEEKLPVADFYATCGEQDELKSLSIDVALHPNDAGYQRMADELLKAFAKVK